MKKIIIAIMVILALAGCASSSKAKEDHAVFETVYDGKWNDFTVIRDKETGREYICYHTGNGAAITPRLSKEGAD